MRRTKIVCTIGPASQSPEVLERLIEAGMDVVRLNFSHGTQEEHGRVIRAVRRIADELERPVAILQDLTGLKIRVGEIENSPVTLEPGARFTLTTREISGNSGEVSVSYPGLPADVHEGDTLLLSDGELELEVQETSKTDIVCQVVVGGPLTSHKGVNLPSRSVRASGLTEKDRDDLAFGIEQGVDYVALSFVRNAADIQAAKEFMKKRRSEIPVVAKIEKHEALENIDEIVPVVDGIMVARGDLGVETPLQKVPIVQKDLIKLANKAGKPVVIATHMLRSMVENPRPTRAEVNDVANAILDGTDAVMLSEETAIGKYPVQAVAMMSKIAKDTETRLPFHRWADRFGDVEKMVAEAVAQAACGLADHVGSVCIITCTQSGGTARLVSKYRPEQTIIAFTPDRNVYRRLALNWGIVPLLSETGAETDSIVQRALSAVLNIGLASKGDRVVVTAGFPVGIPGTTNFIKVEELS